MMNDCCLISEAGARSSLCCFIRFHVEKKEPYRAALGWEVMGGCFGAGVLQGGSSDGEFRLAPVSSRSRGGAAGLSCSK